MNETVSGIRVLANTVSEAVTGSGVGPVPPFEIVYLPFERGPYRMAMALTTVPESTWFEIDDRYVDEMVERRRLLHERHHDVFGALPVSNLAREEALSELVDNLTRYAPQWFTREGTVLHSILTNETCDLAGQTCDPLELAGRLVQEDLCIIHNPTKAPSSPRRSCASPAGGDCTRSWASHWQRCMDQCLTMPNASPHRSIASWPR